MIVKVNKLIILAVSIVLLITAVATIRISLLVTAVLLFLSFVLITSICDADNLQELLERYLK